MHALGLVAMRRKQCCRAACCLALPCTSVVRRLVDSFGSTRRRRQLNAREEAVVRLDKLGETAGALSALVGQIGEQAQRDNITKQTVRWR